MNRILSTKKLWSILFLIFSFTETSGQSTPAMVKVDGGTLAMSMGTRTVAPYSISKTEVTWGQWKAVQTWAASDVGRGYGYDIGNVGNGCADSHPVHSINFYDMVKWCNALSEMNGLTPVYWVGDFIYREGEAVPAWDTAANGFRLPSEVEWEFAARGGTQTSGFTYSGSHNLSEVGWFSDNSTGATCGIGPNGPGTFAVSQKSANEIGIYDMSGNVWEAVWDASFIPLGSTVTRGGSFVQQASGCSVINKGAMSLSLRISPDLGFRVASSALDFNGSSPDLDALVGELQELRTALNGKADWNLVRLASIQREAWGVIRNNPTSPEAKAMRSVAGAIDAYSKVLGLIGTSPADVAIATAITLDAYAVETAFAINIEEASASLYRGINASLFQFMDSNGRSGLSEGQIESFLRNQTDFQQQQARIFGVLDQLIEDLGRGAVPSSVASPAQVDFVRRIRERVEATTNAVDLLAYYDVKDNKMAYSFVRAGHLNYDPQIEALAGSSSAGGAMIAFGLAFLGVAVTMVSFGVGAPLGAALILGAGAAAAGAVYTASLNLSADRYALFHSANSLAMAHAETEMMIDLVGGVNAHLRSGSAGKTLIESIAPTIEAVALNEVILPPNATIGSGQGSIRVRNAGTASGRLNYVMATMARSGTGNVLAALAGPDVSGQILSTLSGGNSRTETVAYSVPSQELFKTLLNYHADIFVGVGPRLVNSADYPEIASQLSFFAGPQRLAVQNEQVGERTLASGKIPPGGTVRLYERGLLNWKKAQFELRYSGGRLELQVGDPQGRWTGYNPANGAVRIQIPSSSYSGAGSNPQVVVISRPAYNSDEYTVEIHNRSNVLPPASMISSALAWAEPAASAYEEEARYSLVMIEVPDLQPSLATSPVSLDWSVPYQYAQQPAAWVTFSEITGFATHPAATLSVSALSGSRGTIPASAITLPASLPPIRAGESQSIELKLNLPFDFPRGIFTGTLRLDGKDFMPIRIELMPPPVDLLWLDASRHGEWLAMEWFGWFKNPTTGWIYHAEHGWWNCVGESTDSFYFYDMALGMWGWTTERAYPWIYWFEPANTWSFYMSGGRPGSRRFFHAGAHAWREEADLKTPANSADWVPEVISFVSLRLTATSATYSDDLGTSTFESAFPNAAYTYLKTSGTTLEVRYQNVGGDSGVFYFTLTSPTSGNFREEYSGPYTGYISGSFEILELNPAVNPSPADMVLVQGGTLAMSMGTVTVATFQIGRTEVTWGEWKTVRDYAAANGYDIGSVGAGCADDHPVQTVAWYDVVKWCNAKSEQEGLTPVYSYNRSTYKSNEPNHTSIAQNLSASGYRLPLEAEWEFAARGGNQSNGYTYSGSNDLNTVGWFVANASGATCDLLSTGLGTWPVGQKAANELGVYDMSGNVWEWCGDGGPVGRNIRGGSWLNEGDVCTVSSRNHSHPGIRDPYLILNGFRLARTHSP